VYPDQTNHELSLISDAIGQTAITDDFDSHIAYIPYNTYLIIKQAGGIIYHINFIKLSS
jgi:hypothetical protein